jgi:multidrug efflux pump subunit AcrA (membrane-fusion protein)
MKGAQRPILMGWLVPVAALVFAAGCGMQVRDRHGLEVQREPTQADVARRDIVAYDTFAGELHVPPQSQAVVFAPYRAPVERVMTSVGQRVSRGDALLELSIPDARAGYEEARAAVRAAETALANARAQMQGPLRDAERQLEQARATERQLRQQTDPMGDATALVNARQNRESAEQAVQLARADLRASLQPFELQLEQARAAFRAAQEGRRLGIVNAPIAGTVLSLEATAGQVVGTDRERPLAQIVDLSAIRVHAMLEPDVRARVEEGSDVVVRFAGVEEPMEGTIRSIRVLPAAPNQPVRHRAEISFRNLHGLVKPESRVESVAVEIDRVENVLSVPVRAIVRDQEGHPTVHAWRQNQWVPVRVETGLSDGAFVEIRAGLQEGETVQLPPAS